VTASEFNGALKVLVNGAIVHGLNTGQMDLSQMIGIIELSKADIIRNVQDQALKAATEPHIIPFRRIPPDGGKQ
jgi:hypothetical protein